MSQYKFKINYYRYKYIMRHDGGLLIPALCFLLLLIGHLEIRVNCYEAAPKTTLPPEPPTTGVLLSAEEFVDFTESPTLLFGENGADQDETTTIKTNAHQTETQTQTQTQPPTPSNESVLDSDNVDNIEVSKDETKNETDTTTTTPNDVEEEENKFKPPQNVSQYMDYIEELSQDLKHQLIDLFEPHLPRLVRTSHMVSLSAGCSHDMLRVALALRRFEPWALKMLDSSGKLPEGIFEGSFTALGSFDQCLSTVFSTTLSSSKQNNEMDVETTTSDTSNLNETTPSPINVTQGKYCLINVSPYLPPKPPADKVDKMFQEEADRRNYAKIRISRQIATRKASCQINYQPVIIWPHQATSRAMKWTQTNLYLFLSTNLYGYYDHLMTNGLLVLKDNQLSRLSPMFYYMKFRIGACIPSSCVESDTDSISSTLSSSLKLNITIASCQVRSSGALGASVTSQQQLAGFIFGLVTLLVVASTLIELARHRTRRDLNAFTTSGRLVESTTGTLGSGAKSNTVIGFEQQKWLNLDKHDIKKTPSDSEDDFDEGSSKLEKVSRPPRWLEAFSVITNFTIYFGGPTNDRAYRQQTRSNLAIGNISDTKQNRRQDDLDGSRIIIKCLDGIRVLSLCWVIVANSYVTLDPRATKRLTKSREAPRDFLFQLIVQASLAIETFFFLSGLLVSLSFGRQLIPGRSGAYDTTSGSDSKITSMKLNRRLVVIRWLKFYFHRYIRLTPATMLVIAFSMWAFRFGDGPLWPEATQRAHLSCSQNWWRHLFHVANFVDTRQMCFIHYWYIAADMQLFLAAPLLLWLLHRRPRIAYWLASLVGLLSICFVFGLTYLRNLPPTLLFYSSDPDSRREFGNQVMTKPLTHALPYLVGLILGHQLISYRRASRLAHFLADHKSLLGLAAIFLALGELFLPYRWNNLLLPSRLLSAAYASLFRLIWSLTLAYLVVVCSHWKTNKCSPNLRSGNTKLAPYGQQRVDVCFCGSGGHLVNRFLSLPLFGHLSRLSFVAYLIHLPLMSMFISQTRGLFAFSHALVMHLALSYLLMTFALSFLLVHIIEFPFLTLERFLTSDSSSRGVAKTKMPPTSTTTTTTTAAANRRGRPDARDRLGDY